MRKSYNLTSHIFRIVSVLICLTLVTTYLLSGMYARYSSTTSGSDSARVAKYMVSAFIPEGQSNNFSLSSDEPTATYIFTVSSDSEVSKKYDVILEFPSNFVLPDGVEITIDNKQASVNNTNNVYTFSNDSWIFTAGKNERTHTLKIDVSSFEQSTIIEGIVVKVVASQID